MPLYMCRQCGCVENTACGHYWSQTLEGRPPVCSECDTGEWHGNFPKCSAAGMLVDQDGLLWRTDDGLPKHYKILGSVLPEQSKEPA